MSTNLEWSTRCFLTAQFRTLATRGSKRVNNSQNEREMYDAKTNSKPA